MPNIGTVLREEILRLSRKESRGQLNLTKKATTHHRKDIAALKRRVAMLERQIALLSRKSLAAMPAAAASGTAAPLRFSAKGLRTHRSRLGLSQAELGAMLAVSSQTIYNWEHEASRPRAEQVARIAALRSLGKREAAARLKQLSSTKKKPKR